MVNFIGERFPEGLSLLSDLLSPMNEACTNPNGTAREPRNGTSGSSERFADEFKDTLNGSMSGGACELLLTGQIRIDRILTGLLISVVDNGGGSKDPPNDAGIPEDGPPRPKGSSSSRSLPSNRDSVREIDPLAQFPHT